MPITATKLEEEGTEISSIKREGVTAGVESFLRENADQAYSTKEIHEATGHNRATVNQVCLKLAKAEKTERKSVDGTVYNRWIGGEAEPEDADKEAE